MKIQIILLFLIFFFNSCVDRNDYIRDVYVNIEIPLNQPEFSELNAIGNSILAPPQLSAVPNCMELRLGKGRSNCIHHLPSTNGILSLPVQFHGRAN